MVMRRWNYESATQGYKNLKKLNFTHIGLNSYLEKDIGNFIESQLCCGVLQRDTILSINTTELNCITFPNECIFENSELLAEGELYSPGSFDNESLAKKLQDNSFEVIMAEGLEHESWCDFDDIDINTNIPQMPAGFSAEDWDSEYNDATGPALPPPYEFEPESEHYSATQQVVDEEENNEIQEDATNKEREYELVESHPFKVYISNINFKTPQYKLWQFMEDNYGDVKYCNLLKDHRRRSKGRGFVMFKSLPAVQKILCASEQDLTLDKRVLKVEPAHWKKYKPSEDEKNDIVKPREIKVKTQPLLESWDDSSTNPDEINSNSNKSTTDPNTKNINDLHEYILLHLFSYLPWNKRIQCERVCKKWRSISMKCWQTTTHLSLYGILPSFTIFTDKILKKLLKRDCTVLESLDLSSVTRMLTSQSLQTIGRQCPNLRRLDLSGISTCNKDVKFLAEGCKYIEWLKLKDCHDLGDKGLWSLFMNCKRLKYLNLEGNRRLTGKQSFHISQPQIQTLILTDCVQLCDEGVLKLANRWNTVTELYLSGCADITDQPFKVLMESCSQITRFEMMGHVSAITPLGYRNLSLLSNLEELNMNRNTSMDDSVLTAISTNCKKLRKLDLMLCWKDITDTGIKSLADCPNLECLDISYLIKISHESVEHLAANGRLKKLTARGCSNVTEQGFQSVISLCPELECLDISGCTHVSCNLLQSFTKQGPLLTSQKGSQTLELFIGGTSIEEDEASNLPDYIKVHFHNLCSDRLRPDREIYIYMGGDSGDEENEADCFDQNYDDLAEDYLDNDDPLYEERFNMT